MGNLSISKLSNVKRSIRTKIIIAIFISLLISSPISAMINAFIQSNIELGSTSVYIHTSVTLFISTLIITASVQFIVINPISKIVEVMKLATMGDLTVKSEYKSDDEIGMLSTSFNKMIASLHKVVEKTSDSSQKVSNFSEDLRASTEQNSSAIDQIADSIQAVVSGSEQQEESAIKLEELSGEITEGMAQSSLAINTMVDISHKNTQKADDGIQLVEKTVGHMNKVQQSVGETADKINMLHEKSREIEAIVKIITGIADQTNLLALNASIEAARAGDHGKGFAVVAAEVRKLAEQSADAAKSIEELIKETQAGANNAVDSMNNGKSTVEEGIELVHKTGASFQDIVINIKLISDKADEVSSIIEQTNNHSNQMKNMIKDIVYVTEQNSGSTQNVAASVEEQTASMDQIASSSVTLSNLSKELQNEINIFTIHSKRDEKQGD